MNASSRSRFRNIGKLSILIAMGVLGYVSANGNPISFLNPTVLIQTPRVGGEAVGVLAMGGGPLGVTGKPAEKIVIWERPTTPLPDWLTVEEQFSLEEQRIRQLLDEPIQLDFDGLSLNTIAKVLRGKFKIAICFDEVGLDEAGVNKDAPLKTVRPAAKLSWLFAHVLEPLQLVYQIEHDSIVITSKDRPRNTIRCYDLSYIFPDSGLVSDLMLSIESMVTPDVWVNVGGTSSMSSIGSMLVISAQSETHDGVANLLRLISKQSQVNMESHEIEFMPLNNPSATTTADDKN